MFPIKGEVTFPEDRATCREVICHSPPHSALMQWKQSPPHGRQLMQFWCRSISLFFLPGLFSVSISDFKEAHELGLGCLQDSAGHLAAICLSSYCAFIPPFLLNRVFSIIMPVSKPNDPMKQFGGISFLVISQRVAPLPHTRGGWCVG